MQRSIINNKFVNIISFLFCITTGMFFAFLAKMWLMDIPTGKTVYPTIGVYINLILVPISGGLFPFYVAINSFFWAGMTTIFCIFGAIQQLTLAFNITTYGEMNKYMAHWGRKNPRLAKFIIYISIIYIASIVLIFINPLLITLYGLFDRSLHIGY